MNMISTGTFLNGMDASNKQSQLVKKLVTAWEKKNNKTARAGGVSLMALSLAACGGEDTTPFAQSDIDAATAPLSAAIAAGEIVLAAAQADAAAARVAQSAAETAAATALVAQAAAEASAAAATASAAAVTADAGAAAIVNAAALAAAQSNAAAATAAQATAEASLATAQAALTAANAEKATLQTSYDALVASNATLQASYDALVAPKSLTLTAATAGETLVGGSGADTFTGDALSLDNNDTLSDATAGDGDVANLSDNGDLNTITLTNIETVNVTVASTAAGTTTVDAAGFSGVDVLNITRADVVVGGSTIAGNKSIVVANMDATDVAKVVAGAGTTTMNVSQATKTGATIDANTASGLVQVLGSGTIDAANATGVNAGGIGTALQDANAITINAAKATTINVGSNSDGTTAFDNTAITGAITINAAAATNVKAAAAGGITVDAKGGTTGVVITGVDASGASVTTSYVGTAAAAGVINIDGSGATDAATVSAIGNVALTTNASDQIETLNLSGNGAAATYAMTGAATTYNVTGSQNVTISGNVTSFAAKTLTDSSSGTSTVNITTNNTADLSGIAADNILISNNAASKTLTVADGATVSFGSDITTAIAIAGKTALSTVNIATADDTAASGATIDIQTGTLTLSGNIATANVDATVGKLTMGTATTLAATGALNVTGTKDVALGAVTAASLDASASSGKISGTFAAVASIKTGSGIDTVTLDDTNSTTSVFALETNGGADDITVTDAKEGTSVDAGAGNDAIKIGAAGSAAVTSVDASYVIVGGAGDDTVTVLADVDTDSIIVGGDGTDTVTFLDTDGVDLSDNVNFSMTGIETVNITALTSGVVKISAAQFAADNSFKLSANAVGDTLHVANTGTTGTTIDAANVTHDATQASTLRLEGKALLADTIMGSAKNDTIVATSGGDTIDGSTGTDTFLAASLAAATIEGAGTGTSTGAVVNLGGTAVTNTTVLGSINGYTGNTVTSVAGGEYAYVYAAAAATNSNVTGNITNVENVTGTGGADYIVGSNGANTIDGGVGADTIVAGLGADVITGGNGIDTISLGLNDAAIDSVIMTTVLAVANRDVVTNFTVGDAAADDTVTIGAANTTVAAAGAADVIASTTAAGTGGGAYTLGTAASNADDVILITATAAGANSGNLASATDGTELLKAMTDASAADTYTGITATAASDTVYLAASQGGKTYLYHADADNGGGANTLITAAEIVLVGTFDAVLDAGSFVLA